MTSPPTSSAFSCQESSILNLYPRVWDSQLSLLYISKCFNVFYIKSMQGYPLKGRGPYWFCPTAEADSMNLALCLISLKHLKFLIFGFKDSCQEVALFRKYVVHYKNPEASHGFSAHHLCNPYHYLH